MHNTAGRMLRTLPLAVTALIVLGGCATKGDVRSLREDLQAMQQRQDAALRELQQQNAMLLDSIRTTMSMTVDTRGTTANSLRQFDQSVDQLASLVSQVMGTLTRIEQRLSALEQRPVAAAGSGVAPGGGTAEEYYRTGTGKLEERSYAAAVMAFEQIVLEYPQHARAPDAQFQLGEAYYLQEQYDEAYAALETVAERWPDAVRAPGALYRAGAIAEEQRDFDRARGFYERVRADYASSEEARQAATRLRALPGR